MTSSGTYDFSSSYTLADLAIEALGRCQVRPPSIATDHMLSVRRCTNLTLARWSNRGVNLWRVDQVTVPLIQGTATYPVDEATVTMLDTYIRTFPMGNPEDIAIDFSTTSSSAIVTIGWPDNGTLVGNYINVIVPVSVGGIVISGFYQVASTPDDNTITIEAADNATATVNNGGAVPLFTTTLGDNDVTVTLADHGYLAGDTFPVQVATTVGGLVISGNYTISSITDADNFVIPAGYAASSSATGFENDEQAQLAGQSLTNQPVDRMIYPISRNDYAALPNKASQAPPTSYWFNRQISPNVTLWQVPDSNGPYALIYYRLRQIQDANPQAGQTADVPYRFLEALTAGVTAMLAITWKPDFAPALKAYADECWTEAAEEDREQVNTYMVPQMDGYWN